MSQRKASFWRTLSALTAGALFAAGLALGGMTQPAKVIGFLDFFGDWDPSLIFVMGGAVGVYAVLFRLSTKRNVSLFGGDFSLPTKTQIDAPLVVGAALFGVGWGMSGFCPGPAMCSLATGRSDAFLFVGAMLLGLGLTKGVQAVLEKRRLDGERAREQRNADLGLGPVQDG